MLWIGDAVDAYVCRAAREAFKGALNYVFGNKAELEIKRLVTRGDNYCEVKIKLDNCPKKINTINQIEEE